MGMGKEKTICRGGRDDDFFPLRDDLLIPILVRLPMVSLLRFKSVCKYWLTLVESSFFTHLLHLHTFNSSSSSDSSSNFGTFILQASSYKYGGPSPFDSYAVGIVETEIILLSSESESESMFRLSRPPRSGSGGWCWSTDDDDDDNLKVYGPKDDDDHVFNVDDDDNMVFKLDSLGLPSSYKFWLNCGHRKVMVGSCNGLICLYDEDHMEVTLWNPATRQLRILPKSKSITTIEESGNSLSSYHLDHFVGFGFDIKTKDYKVVLLSFFRRYSQSMDCMDCQVQVYSLSTDSWRLLEEEGFHSLPSRPNVGSHGLYLNGSCFFVAINNFPSGGGYESYYMPRSVISFNFTREIITTMEFPDDLHHDPTQLFYLTYFGDDKMALFTIRNPPHDYDHDYENCYYVYYDCDIWVVLMNEGCGGMMDKDSWTKLHSFQMKTRIDEHDIIPRGISNNGEFALLELRGHSLSGLNKKMRLYNLVTKEAKKDFLSCNMVMSRAGVYKPSIVSIIGGKNGSQG